MKKLLFLSLAAASLTLASCNETRDSRTIEGTSDGSVNDGTVDAGIRRQDTASTNGNTGTMMDTTAAQ